MVRRLMKSGTTSHTEPKTQFKATALQGVQKNLSTEPKLERGDDANVQIWGSEQDLSPTWSFIVLNLPLDTK